MTFRFNVCSDVAYKETQTLEIRGVHRFWKTAWDERPVWMRTVYSGKEGEFPELMVLSNFVQLWEEALNAISAGALSG